MFKLNETTEMKLIRFLLFAVICAFSVEFAFVFAQEVGVGGDGSSPVVSDSTNSSAVVDSADSAAPAESTDDSSKESEKEAKVPRTMIEPLSSSLLPLFWTIGLLFALVFLVKFSSFLRFGRSGGAFKTIESGYTMRGRVELATIKWRDKSILLARSGDVLVKLSETEREPEEENVASEEKESPEIILKKYH